MIISLTLMMATVGIPILSFFTSYENGTVSITKQLIMEQNNVEKLILELRILTILFLFLQGLWSHCQSR
jgi:hypothetical protein